MGIRTPGDIIVPIVCDGLFYGEHGYKSTKCFQSQMANRCEATVPTRDIWNDGHVAARVPDVLPLRWGYIDGRYACPDCIKEAYAESGDGFACRPGKCVCGAEMPMPEEPSSTKTEEKP